MATVDIKKSDFVFMCRMCLGRDAEMRCFFPADEAVLSELKEMENIRNMINNLIIYPISLEEDNLPDKICLKCIDLLRLADNFKNQCERSYELLTSIRDTHNAGLNGCMDIISLDESDDGDGDENACPEFIETISDDGEFDCLYCVKTFSEESLLHRHISTMHMNKCSKCKLDFSSMDELNAHNTEFHLNIKTEDNTSDDGFENEMPDSSGRFRCRICHKSYGNFASLRRHEMGHISKKPKCKICNKVFSRADYLRVHQLRLHSVKPYTCPICGEGFSLANDIKRHQSRCHAEIRLDDSSNNQEYSSPEDIKPTCNSKTIPSLKVVHKIITKGRKKMPKERAKCNICDKSYSRTTHLRRHEKYAHSNPPMPRGEHFCAVCGKCYSFPGNLIHHIRRFHPDYTWSCEQCPETFQSRELFVKHVRSHRYWRPSEISNDDQFVSEAEPSSDIMDENDTLGLEEQMTNDDLQIEIKHEPDSSIYNY